MDHKNVTKMSICPLCPCMSTHVHQCQPMSMHVHNVHSTNKYTHVNSNDGHLGGQMDNVTSISVQIKGGHECLLTNSQ
jgi:hypothetical protein